ncbi:MAG: aminomethyltransferase beta-barrel domain-containing protein, partial [Actinomycetota bacterium]
RAALDVLGSDEGLVRWSEPQRRVSPGQSAVFYDVDGDVVLGGGVVSSPSARPGRDGQTVTDRA